MAEGDVSFADRALEAVLGMLSEGALLFEGEALTCRAATERAAEILGVSRDSLLGRSRAEVLAAIVPGDEATVRALAALREAEIAEPRSEILAMKAEPPRLIEWTTAAIMLAEERIGRVDLLAGRSVEALLREELDRAYAKLAETSLVDELTGLANRKHFENEIDREHRRSQRAWASYAVARVDVDGMGKLNDELGREAGDRLLRRAGEVLKAARREYDLVARWENDELIVLLPGIDERSVKAVLSRSVSAMRDAAHELAGREVTFCAGVSLWIPPSIEAANEVIDRAGIALRAAKAMGRGHMEIDARVVEWKDDPAASSP